MITLDRSQKPKLSKSTKKAMIAIASVIQLHIYVITQPSLKLCEELENLYLVTLTATSSWVALVRTLNN